MPGFLTHSRLIRHPRCGVGHSRRLSNAVYSAPSNGVHRANFTPSTRRPRDRTPVQPARPRPRARPASSKRNVQECLEHVHQCPPMVAAASTAVSNPVPKPSNQSLPRPRYLSNRRCPAPPGTRPGAPDPLPGATGLTCGVPGLSSRCLHMSPDVQNAPARVHDTRPQCAAASIPSTQVRPSSIIDTSADRIPGPPPRRLPDRRTCPTDCPARPAERVHRLNPARRCPPVLDIPGAHPAPPTSASWTPQALSLTRLGASVLPGPATVRHRAQPGPQCPPASWTGRDCPTSCPGQDRPHVQPNPKLPATVHLA